MSADGQAADEGGDPHDGSGGAAQRISHPRHPEDDADRDDRVARREEDDVGLPDGVEDPGSRGGAVHADGDEALGGDRGLVPHPPLLEVDGALSLLVLDDHVGLDGGVRHGQQPDPVVGEPPPPGQPLRDLRQGHPLPEPLGAHDVGAEVEVAEPEPLGHGAVGRELALHTVALVRAAPALPLVDAAAQGVHERVEVRADPQAEQADVVAGVADDGELGVAEPGGAVEVGAEAAQEACASDAAGQCRDAHGVQSSSPPQRPSSGEARGQPPSPATAC
jgi:hypothetical protein